MSHDIAAEEVVEQNQDQGQSSGTDTLWQINISPKSGMTDRLAQELASDCQDASIPIKHVECSYGYLVQGEISPPEIHNLATSLLVDSVVQDFVVEHPGADSLNTITAGHELIHVLLKPGVTDPEAETARMAACRLGVDVSAIRTFRQFRIAGIPKNDLKRMHSLLANDSIEQLIAGPIDFDSIELGSPYEYKLTHVEIREVDDEQLMHISRHWQLSLTLIEMQTIQQHYRELDREPTDAELETIAQTWSEHCSHKTLAGRIDYEDENGVRKYENMLKETIFAATNEIREMLGEDDWCVSVFKDNAGIVRFDDQYNVTFKVETHNRPSAIEPYGGANTGIGGVIRDTLGTGMGAKPVCNTDVFCFADPETANEDLPPGVLHPRRVMKGVVAGVRDYGNRMGIPTVNGAVYFDKRYVGNPLVFCGNVGILPHEMSFKEPQPNDLIVSIGGRTGRDGIRGATFSSAELTEDSDVTSGGSVQIGNAITEKMVMDVLLAARDEGLYNAVTDCGAGGFSSAVGEMGEEIGAEVWLDKAPLKYEGLSYTEIWISEAQERMVFAVPQDKWQRFEELCASESVEATVIGKFVPTGNLVLKYQDNVVADLAMSFMHDGRPAVIRKATYQPVPETDSVTVNSADCESTLKAILGSLNVASKHWVIRQYDHEVLGGSVVKPLVGVMRDGPSDAAVVRPRLETRRGLAISCGMNPCFGDIDPYHMAASSIDEAIRNCVAVGSDPDRIAILDNFCWGYTDRPETLGALVRAAIACQDMALKYKTPFISGKDSLNNEFSYTQSDGTRKTISIPATLLISALGQVPDVGNCVTMDLKRPGNVVYLLGQTFDEMGGSHWNLVNEVSGGSVPRVDADRNRGLYLNLHKAISAGLIRACHDLSEGGLAVAAAEMAFAGGFGLELELDKVCERDEISSGIVLFSESNGRLLCEVEAANANEFESVIGDQCCQIGSVNDGDEFVAECGGDGLIRSKLDDLKSAWQSPLNWS